MCYFRAILTKNHFIKFNHLWVQIALAPLTKHIWKKKQAVTCANKREKIVEVDAFTINISMTEYHLLINYSSYGNLCIFTSLKHLMMLFDDFMMIFYDDFFFFHGFIFTPYHRLFTPYHRHWLTSAAAEQFWKLIGGGGGTLTNFFPKFFSTFILWVGGSPSTWPTSVATRKKNAKSGWAMPTQWKKWGGSAATG